MTTEVEAQSFSNQIGYAAISATGSTDNTVVAAVTGKRIRVLAYSLVCSGAVTCRFESNAGGTALTGQMSFAANGGISAPPFTLGHFQTTAGQLLNLEISDTGVTVAGHLTYELV